MAFISGYLDTTFNLGTVEISKVFLISGIAAVLASPFSGWLSDRFSKRGVFLVANSLLAIPLILITFAKWDWSLFGILFLISLAVSFRQTALQTLQTELIESENRGSYLALRNCFSQLGIATATFFSAIIYNNVGYKWVTVFAAILMIGGTLMVLFFVREPERKIVN
jgi:predicted MFS family arabinose efflux permease